MCGFDGLQRAIERAIMVRRQLCDYVGSITGTNYSTVDADLLIHAHLPLKLSQKLKNNSKFDSRCTLKYSRRLRPNHNLVVTDDWKFYLLAFCLLD